MEEIGTDTLRKLASCWTLAGDEKLLTILQNTHQRLVARCQETSCQLEQMASALDDTSIRLHNVNNQFMSLSSSQFIESRVYDDDVDVTTDNTSGKEAPVLSAVDELGALKRSVAVISSKHEVITIVGDSDTDDSDDELPDRQVLKPKDVYEDRPLPYIIGSEPWKNKWHAGLVVEDSDTDSSTSKVERDSDQYSHSEPEDYAPSVVGLGDTVPEAHGTNLSESSSELPSEPVMKPTPSDVASEIARRLGVGLPPKMPREPEEEPATPIVTKMYKPQEPIASTIFPDEPPPLDYQTDSDTDIFADLHRNQPYKQTYGQGDVARHLFGGSEGEDAGDIFNDFANQPPMTKPTSLFESGPKPHMFDKQHITTESPSRGQTNVTEQSAGNIQRTNDTVDTVNDKTVKKPVGGISLFGSNKGTENIGAAILKRHQRQLSSSDDGSGSETLSEPHKQQSKKEKDIFDDLFAKNESKKTQKGHNTGKDIIQEIQKKNEGKVKKDIPKPVDLFSDNLFDDIDDIFTTNVVKTAKNSKNTIFEDEDALFSDITDHKVNKSDSNPNNNKDKKTGIFDSDDDLFSEKPKVHNKPQPNKIFVETTKTTTVNKVVQPPAVANATSLFDNDDDNIFSDTKISEVKINTVPNENPKLITPDETSKHVFNSPSLFDDDDDDSSDLFKESIKSPNVKTSKLRVDNASYNNTSQTEANSIGEKSNIETLKSNDVTASVSTKSANKSSNHMEKTNSSTPRLVTTGISKEATDNIDSTLLKQDATASEHSNNDFDIKRRLKDNICDTSNISNEVIETRNSNVGNDTPVSNTYNNSETLDQFNVQNSKVDDIINNTFSRNIKKASPYFENNKNDIVNDSSDEGIFTPQKDGTGKAKSEINLSDNNSNKTLNSDIFSDILSEPPVFEKPKEPKKSKNVNALFDDDSDDESLFFKKDDVVSDDNQEEFIPAQNTLFDIFTDGPPEEDLNDNVNHGIFSSNSVAKNNVTESEPIGVSYPAENKKITTSNINVEQKRSEILVTETMTNIGDIFKLLSEEAPPIDEKEGQAFNEESISHILKPPDLKTGEQLNFEKPETRSVGDIIESLQSADNKSVVKPVVVKETGSFNDDIFKRVSNSNSSIVKKDGYLFNNDDKDDEGLFQSLPVQLSKPMSQLSETDDRKHDFKSDEEQCQSLPNIDILKLDKEESSAHISDLNHEKLISESISTGEKTDKKVGKLKIGLNINVKALLPGASPTKIKNIDSLDGQTQSNVKVETKDPKPIQTVGFESKLESEILDNKLSKERPRIQVKRRPSTRKARKEAVRKSGINFGEDSTDNSSSIDDPPKVQTEIQPDTVEQIETISHEYNFNKLSNDEIAKKDELNDIENLKVNTEIIECDNKPIKESIQAELQTENINSQVTQPVKSNSTTKIVYILNDEDIFNTSTIETGDITTNVIKNTGNVESNVPKTSDNLNFNAVGNVNSYIESQDNINVESPIKTLGKTYETPKGDKTKTSLFGEDDDDEIFRNKKPVAKASIFDSDSDNELFGITKKAEVKKIETVQVKGSLFGDDDDDDLFGVKTKKTNADAQPQSKSVPSVKETTACTLPVFEDPLSMFNDDE